MSGKEHRILLIQPPFNRLYKDTYSLGRVPLSLSYLAGTVMMKKPEWWVGIYNSDFSPRDEAINYRYETGQGFVNYLKNLRDLNAPIWEEIRNTIKEHHPSVVGITAKSQNFTSACIVAGIVKSIDKNILVIVGGPHASIAKTEILKDPVIDIGVFGEGEETMVDILDSIEGGRPISSIKGIIYRQGNDIVENPPRELISDLDSLPFPVNVAQKALLDFDKYPLQAFKYIFTIRGCPYNCSFCGSSNVWSRKVRFRSVENIIAEIKEIRKIGLDYIHFDDDTFGVRKTFIKELCDAIKKNCPGLSWSCEMHIKLIDDETIAVMKAAGCRSIQIGIESGSNEMLKLIRKNITIEEAHAAARIIKRHKIVLQTFFMVGFPQETEDTLNDTISAIYKFPSDSIICSTFTPYLGTELFNYCKQQGTIPQDFDVSLYNHHSPENYFCKNISKDVFKDRIHDLGKTLDKINNRRKLKRSLSYEGFLKLKEKGIVHGVSHFLHFCRNAMPIRSLFEKSDV
ncbi:MAG TPA: B12-binding domain-containing radical SAM protein [Candidatus Brocadiaceae bacterium]